MYKINFIVVLMLVVVLLVVNVVDGIIIFNGKVIDKICIILILGGKDFVVILLIVLKNILVIVGVVVGCILFVINLIKCSVGNVVIYFELGLIVDFNSGCLVNQVLVNVVINVQLQLLGLNNQFLLIKVVGVGLVQINLQWVIVGIDGLVDLNYYVEYYVIVVVILGDVISSVKYMIIYN